MSEQSLGALIVALTKGLCGLGMVWLGRSGARRSIDWSWGGHTADNTSASSWNEAHQVAGPVMEKAGWLMVLSGLIGGPVLAESEGLGLLVLGLLVTASLGVMGLSIARGLKVLQRPASPQGPKGPD